MNAKRDMPLSGKRVLVTRAAHQAGELSARLRELGAEPIEYPVIAIAPPKDLGRLDQALARAARGGYDWIVFTSANGVAAVAERMAALGLEGMGFGQARVAVIGPATARAAAELLRRPADVMPSAYVAEALAEAMGDVRGQSILLARADIARPALPQALRAAGAQVDEVIAYRTVTEEPAITRQPDVLSLLAQGQIDAITFTSSSTVRAFIARVGRQALSDLHRVVIACIGPITAEAARAEGLSPTVVAEEYTVNGLVTALVRYYGRQTYGR
ncbi:MAG: uroporphyrinogen-III synthase [Anaerolineae bacterium]|nr:uroporphyrinogen-III synthase [Anaerolineae bacterium]MDW8098185.1 uroporphyrinogen-III synthase [Anaerolineae bacterium]